MNYIRIDGLLHIETCALIYIIIEAICPWWVALIATVAAAVGKEIYDRLTGKGTPEWHDIICDAVGLVAAILYCLIP